MIGKTSKIFILALGIALTLCTLTLCISTAEPGLAAPARQDGPSATLGAASGMTIDFYPGNDDRNPLETPPHLVLRRNGQLTEDPGEHTLIVTVNGVDIGATVAVTVTTEHVDLDRRVNTPLGPMFPRIIAWREVLTADSSPFTFSHEFAESIQYSAVYPDGSVITDEIVPTPTDYFRIEIEVDGQPVPVAGDAPKEYAFLMENQLIEALDPPVPDTWPNAWEATPGAAPDLIVYYCDMFPIELPGGEYMKRSDALNYIETQLVPEMAGAVIEQTLDWGMGPWYDEWTPWRDEEDEELLSVALARGHTWYHGKSGNDSQISILASDRYYLSGYDEPIDAHMKEFHHELFHNLQKNIQNAVGQPSRWLFFIEGQAKMAESVAQPTLQFGELGSGGVNSYRSSANQFLWTSLNNSYTNLNVGGGADVRPYMTALYWRFLYEQCGGITSPATGMQVIKRSLEEMFLEEKLTQDNIVEGMPGVMDRALAGASCAFLDPTDTEHTPYEQSLIAFARANYSLRLDDSEYYEQPGNLVYTEPPADSWPQYTLGTSGPVHHTGEIASSFGMDFAEVEIVEVASGTPILPLPLVIRFEQSNPAEEFHVQFLHLAPGSSPRRSGSGNRLKISQVHPGAEVIPIQGGTGERTITIRPQHPTPWFNPDDDLTHLGFIVVRLDTGERSGTGAYTITLTSDTTPPEITHRVESTEGGSAMSALCSDYLYKIKGYDLHSGLGKLTVIDKKLGIRYTPISLNVPPATWETIYSFSLSPGQSVDYKFILTDVAGNSTDYELKRSRGKNEACGPPGGDHMDDNFSAASAVLAPVERPPGARESARVGILEQGFFVEAGSFVERAGEPYSLVSLDFDPAATAARYPVLVIPSAGLYGVENSTSFRARLEEYTRLGGTILAFDQQHGYEYTALPSGEVGGYGWNEDISCSGASLMMESWHPLLSGLDRAEVHAHVDGFFDSWPEDAQILLSRKANGRPAAILYPYPSPPLAGGSEGGHGWVFATTMYDDWGSGHGQSYADARVIMRDLLTWAIDETLPPLAGGDGGGALPQFTPGDPVTLAISMTNTSAYTATTAFLRLVDPARQVVLTRTVPVTPSTPLGVGIPPNSTGTVVFTTTASTPLGVWRVDGQLLVGESYPLTGKQQVARYVVARPPALVDPARSLYLSITAENDTFVYGEHAVFTYHVYNYGSEPLTATVHYGFNHDFDWHGIYRVLAEDVVVPPADGETPGEVAIPLDHLVRGPFMLRGHVIVGSHRSYAGFGVKVRRAETDVRASLDPGMVQRTRTTTLDIDVCRWRSSLTTTLSIRAMDSGRTLYHTDTLTVTLDGRGCTNIGRQFVVPGSIAAGTGKVWIEARSLDGEVLGGTALDLTVPASPLVFAVSPPPLAVESTVPISVAVTNTSPSLAIESGTLTVTLVAPGGAITSTATTGFTAAPSSSQVVTLPLTMPPLAFGTYTATIETTDEYGTLRDTLLWHTIPLVQGTLDAATYRARGQAHLDLRLANPGPILLPLTVTLQSPISTPQSRQFTLTSNSNSASAWDIPIPPNVTAGSYPITLTLTPPSGGAQASVLGPIQVPPSSLTVLSASSPASAGQAISITIVNEGGAASAGAYDLSLIDAKGTTILEESGELPLLYPGDDTDVTFTVPAGAASGAYTLVGSTDDPQADEVRPFVRTVQISGAETRLDARTDRQTYAVDEVIDVTAVVTNVGTALNAGDLTLQIVHRQPTEGQWPAWRVYDPDNSGLSSRWLRSAAVDNDGNVWFSRHDDYGGAETLEVLLADLETWVTYEMPLPVWQVSDITVDGDNQKWFATNAGVARLSADNTTWNTFTTGNSGLVSNYVNSVAIDADGNAWFGTNEGVSKLTPDGQWETYTTANSGLLSNRVYVIAVDPQGNVWIGTGGGLNVVTEGEWQTYTSKNSELLTNYVYDIAFDAEGNGWLLTPGYGGGVSVFMSDGDWMDYTRDNSDLSSEYGPTAIAVDEVGRVWIGQNGYGVDVLLPDRETWLNFDRSEDGVLSSNSVNDVTVGAGGDVWLATEPYDAYEPEGGVTRAYDPGSDQQVLWTQHGSLDLSSPDVFSDTWAVEASMLGVTGKLYLEGTLTSPTGQEIVYDEQAFYVFPGDIIVTLDADRAIGRPGEEINLSGRVENTGAVTLTGRTLVVSQDGVIIHTVGPFDLPPGESVDFGASASAPAGVDTTYFAARLAEVEVVEAVRVGEPEIEVDVQTPSLAGGEPFSLILMMDNTGLLEGIIDVMIDSSDAQHEVRHTQYTVPAGGMLIQPESYAISADTTLTVTVTGDAAYILTYDVVFGEAAEVIFSPEAVYAEGPVAIPYTAENIGLLPVGFATDVTIQSLTSNLQSSISIYLPAGASTADDLLFADLSPGDYTLTYATPFGSGEAIFRVAPAFGAALSATVEPVAGSVTPIAVDITNTGVMDIDGVLRVESAFFTAEQPVSIPSVGTSVDTSVDLTTAPTGTHPITITLLSGGGLALSSTTVSVTVPEAGLVLTTVPTGTVLQAGEWVTLTFDVKNTGVAPATAVLSATVGDLLNEAQGVWLTGGESGTVDFVFQVPEGLLDDGSLVCIYWFEGQRYDFELDVAGVDVEVAAEFDSDAYLPGETAALQVTVSNDGLAPTPPLYAHVAYQGQVYTQPLSLEGGQTLALDFALTATEGDSKVFYALYEVREGRGVYLNTTYLTMRYPDVTLVLDEHVYEPGDTVHVTVQTDRTGGLNVSAPGFATTLQLSGSDTSFQFTLNDDLMRGTYTIDYALDDGPTHSVLFDVDAPWVRVTEARLEGLPYTPGDEVQADLTIASTHALDVGVRAWLVYPDGTRGEEMSSAVDLDEVLNNHVAFTLPLPTIQAGPHRLVYLLVDSSDAERVYAAGSETFDVGDVTVLGVRTDHETYDGVTDSVTATLTIYAAISTDASVGLLLDGISIASYPLTLTEGTQTIVVPVPGPFAPDWHDLTARVEADGLSHAAHTTFAYDTKAGDLVAGTPYLASTTGTTRTLRVWVINSGATDTAATTAQIWDGDPDTGGELLGTQPIPALVSGEGVRVELTWDVLQQAGLHTLFVIVDPDDVVAEFYEYNNVATGEVVVPPFALAVETAITSYDEGDPVDVTVRLTNLTDGPLTAVVTTTVELVSHQVVFTDVHAIQAAAVYAERTIPWDTAWAENGAYTVRAAGAGGISSNDLTVLVNNVPPAVDAGPDLAAGVGQEVGFGGSFTDPGLSDTHAAMWDFGDGSASLVIDGVSAGDALTVTHSYVSAGVYTVTLTVVDSDGGVGSDTTVVTVSGAPPEVNAGPDQIVQEGQVVHFDSAITTSSPIDTILWDLGDGTTTEGTLTPEHTYADNAPGGGVYTVTLTVTDTVGLTGSDSLRVVVENAPPVVNAGPDQAVDEGQMVHFDGGFADPGVLDTHTILWDFGDGNTAEGSLTPNHTYAQDGTYMITLTIADDNGGMGSDALVVIVDNVLPQVEAGPNQAAQEGQVVTFDGSFTDPGALDPHTITWDFGDGTVASGALTISHAYVDDAPGGVYTVTLTITDDDGAGSDTFVVAVENIPPEVEAGADQTVEEGQVVQFDGSFTDPGVLDTHTILWDFGDGNTITGTLTPEHTYASDGVYTATLTVTDDDGGVGSDVVQIVVLPRAEFETFEIEHATLHWWARGGGAHASSPSAFFRFDGQLTLPEGYTLDDLTRDLQLTLTIKGKSVSDTISLDERGRVWLFRDPKYPHHSVEGLRITHATLWHRPESSSVRFILYGVFSIDDVNRYTRPTEATVNLGLGVTEEDGVDQITGEREITFRTLHCLWWYRKRRWLWCK